MDGIPVKVNEKYKPPPKISLPACILNRLNNVQFMNYAYDFSLETTVAEHMARLNKISLDEIDKYEGEKVSPEPEKTGLSENNGGVSEATILTPVPISTCGTVTTSRKENIFKYSDFENDTSSPFDNEELKTLNDMEELAHVLGATSVSGHAPKDETRMENWTYGSPSQSQFYPNVYSPISMSTSHPSYSSMPSYRNTNYGRAEVFSQEGQPTTVYAEVKTEASRRENGADEDGNVSDIVKSLEEYLGQRRVPQNPSPPKDEPPTFFKLNDQQQAMARQMGDMGFPLSRAVCAVNLFGSDESKIIEYLLLVQSLVDKGYSESQTLLALELNQCDETQTENYLKVLSQIMKLGFKQEEVINALAKTKNDRDKALEILIR